MSIANYAETAILDWVLGGATPTRPSARYVALHTGDPGETGASNEISGNGYSRQSVTFAAASSGSAASSSSQSFTASGGSWGTITHCSIWDAASSGNCLWSGTCTNKTVASGDGYAFASGAITVSLD